MKNFRKVIIFISILSIGSFAFADRSRINMNVYGGIDIAALFPDLPYLFPSLGISNYNTWNISPSELLGVGVMENFQYNVPVLFSFMVGPAVTYMPFGDFIRFRGAIGFMLSVGWVFAPAFGIDANAVFFPKSKFFSPCAGVRIGIGPYPFFTVYGGGSFNFKEGHKTLRKSTDPNPYPRGNRH